jgi:predicted component of type VI protein secretion system
MTTFTLTMTVGPAAGQVVELQRRTLLLGRDPTCDVVVDDVEVSRRHARLIAQNGGYTVEDLGSTNGTFVNEKRIRSIVPLLPGSTIRLGEQITFNYEVVPADKSETRDFAATPPSVSQQVAARSPRAVPPAPVRNSALPIQTPLAAAPEPDMSPPAAHVRMRRKGLRLPIFSRPWMIGCAAVLLLGLCSSIAFFWYVDANYLWCDVFGSLITACR